MKATRIVRALCVSLLSVQLWAQAPADSKAVDAPAAKVASSDDLNQLREQIAQQEQAIKKLQESLQQQQALLEKAVANKKDAPATPASATATGVESAAEMVPVVNVVKASGGRGPQTGVTTTPSPSPLSISLGNTTLTPLGFMDATFFVRSTNVGSGIGTNFAGVPYNNVGAGHLSESNFSAQNSRVGFRVDSNFMGWKVLGYLEADFLFNNNANSFQIGSNSAGFRLRNYFVDVQKDSFEVLGGQDWSMLTPNRKGLSPIPSDIFYTQNMDTNYQIGLPWTRATQFRFIGHPNDHVAFGIALENPQQYIGGGNGSGAITAPAGLSGIAGQFQANTSASGVPNSFPDIIAKVAFDGSPADHAMHFEVAGFLRGFKDYIPAGTAGGIVGTHSAVGGGGEVNSNIEVFKNVKLVENVFFSDGGGRYLFGSSPDFILRPTGQISLIHAHSTVDGIEAQVTKNTLLALYYSGMYIGKDVALDTNGKPVGYGFTGSGATQNRYIQEITFDWVQTLWKNKNYGALSLINQYSYIFREPWFVGAGSPKQAHTNMVYVDLRYTLP